MNGAAKQHASVTPASLELRQNIYQTTSKASKEISPSEAQALANGANGLGANGRSNSATYTCDTCGVDCTAARYHSLKVKNFELCPSCYLDGRFPSTMFSGDFVKLTAAQSAYAQGASSDDWTDQEMLLLFEGVEMYDDDWSAIEEHVGTRSAQQCIKKFLELPIEDPYLEAESEGSKGPLRYARLPFEQADNPVMSVVSFLAGVLGTGVASEAAKAAVKELTNGETAQDEQAEEDATKEERTEKADEIMDTEEKERKTEAEGQDGPSTEEKPGDEAMNVDDQTSVSKSKKPAISQSKVQRAAKLALQSSAKAARELADAEEAIIRSTLAKLIQLTLTKLELKMSQFEEMETLLEEERRNLESQRLALANERAGLKRVMENVRAELEKQAQTGTSGIQGALAHAGATLAGQPTKMSEVQGDVPMTGDAAPVENGTFSQIG